MFLNFITFVCVFRHKCSRVCNVEVKAKQKQHPKVSALPYQAHLRDQPQILSVGGKRLNPLSQLAGP